MMSIAVAETIHTLDPLSSMTAARVRVLGVIASSDLGGAERAFVSALKGLDPARFDASVICHPRGQMVDEYRRCARDVSFLNLQRLSDPRTVLRLATMMRRRRIDVVISCLWTADAQQ